MKTFSATHLNKHAQEVFAAAKDDGAVFIGHDRFSNGAFVLVWNDNSPDYEMLKQKFYGDKDGE